MGCYVNPTDRTKEEFLREHGVPTNGPGPIDETFLPVCLVDNGGFTAAMVGFEQGEVIAMSQPYDHRPKKWYLVSRENLRKASDLIHYEK